MDPAPAPAPDPSPVGAGALRHGVPLGLYVHFPFCGVHCPYCDFAVEVCADIPHDAYAGAVIAEIDARRAWFAGAGPLQSIYFGGGTPGLWRADALARVIDAGCAAFGISREGRAALEITVEANPGEVDQPHLAALARAGVNRVSLGAQSFDDGQLRRIGRNHAAAAIPAAVTAARAAGIDNLSLDLMFGLPGQTPDDWRRDVEAALALAPEHLSAYALTIERGTPFGALDRTGRLARPDDEAVAAMFDWGRRALAAAGLAPYEISSYARPGRRARHNSLYWQVAGAAYLGVGASASSFRPLADGTGWRFANPRATATYLRAVAAGAGSPAPVHVERRSRDDLENEALWLGLRTSEGVDRAAHRRRYGRDPGDGREAAIAACLQAGWLAVGETELRLTPAGVLYADEVASRLWREAGDG
ncbi:MAG TPA: radical SAM family heme chaperone HemW [Polyangia bacterium]|nr:radical SAM family heme chaperone HemW [Polyangia bacterium]